MMDLSSMVELIYYLSNAFYHLLMWDDKCLDFSIIIGILNKLDILNDSLLLAAYLIKDSARVLDLSIVNKRSS